MMRLLRRLLPVLIVLCMILPVFVPAEVVEASDDFSVQRGLISLTGTTTTIEITLDTPVPVGQSFVITSIRSPRSSCAEALARVELTTVVSGEYTKLKATRNTGGSGLDTHVKWQVISGSQFTVQSGISTYSATTETESINAVTLSRAFIVLSNHTAGSDQRNLVRARFTSSTEIELRSHLTSAKSVSWYVVEWNGATVQSGLVTVDSTTKNQSISSVTLSQTFLLFSFYGTTDLTYRAWPSGHLSSTTNIQFLKHQHWSGQHPLVSYFVVSHPELSVQRGSMSISGSSVTSTLGSAVDVDRSFTATTPVGNAYLSHHTASRVPHYNTHKLWQDGTDSKITVERASTSQTLEARWEVVYLLPPPPLDVNTHSATDIDHESATLHGETLDAEATERGFVWDTISRGNPGNTSPAASAYTNDWTESGTFSPEAFERGIAGLDSDETYYFRAAAYEDEWLYGDELEFTTASPPTVSTHTAQDVKDTIATLRGEVTDTGGSNVVERGFDWGTSPGVYTDSWTETGTWGASTFSRFLEGLPRGVAYYYRARARNADGWGYGAEVRFATYNPSIYASCTEDDDSSATFYGSDWYAQTFTPYEGFTLAAVRIKAARVGDPGPLTVSIRETTDLGHPRTLDLVSTTYDGLSTGTDWYEIALPEYPLANREYALVVRAVAGDSSNYVVWRYDSGSVCDGCYTSSVNSGTTWTLDCSQSFMYEIRGHTTLQILDAKVFTGYLEEGDWLITAYYLNKYPPYYGTTVMSEYFALQLLVDGVPVASTRLRQWGNMPGSIYLNKAAADSLEWGSTYQVRMIGIVDPYPSTSYTLIPSDWRGTMERLDTWVINTAKAMSNAYETVLIAVITGTEVLNEAGGVYFATGIPELRRIRPHLFLYGQSTLDPDHKDYTRDYELSEHYVDMLGPKITDDAASIGAIFGLTPLAAIQAIFFGTWLIAIVGVAMVAGSAAIVVSVPALIIGMILRILPWAPIVSIIAIVLLVLVYVVWWRGT